MKRHVHYFCLLLLTSFGTGCAPIALERVDFECLSMQLPSNWAIETVDNTYEGGIFVLTTPKGVVVNVENSPFSPTFNPTNYTSEYLIDTLHSDFLMGVVAHGTTPPFYIRLFGATRVEEDQCKIYMGATGLDSMEKAVLIQAFKTIQPRRQ